jgi:hypothetical protein
MLGHVPPLTHSRGILYMPNCKKTFSKLLGEYSDVIITSYYGHVNWDVAYLTTKIGQGSYEMIPVSGDLLKSRSSLNLEIVGSFYTGPSIIPFFNSGFRLGTLKKHNKTAYLAEHRQFYANLTQHNWNHQNRQPIKNFYESSCSTKKWSLTTLEPSQWIGFFKGIQKEIHTSKRSQIASNYKRCNSVHIKATYLSNPELALSRQIVVSVIFSMTIVFVIGIGITVLYGSQRASIQYFQRIFLSKRNEYQPIP